MIIPILTELCVHMVVNYIYGTETPFPCRNYQYVRRKLKYSKSRCLYYTNSCALCRMLLLGGDLSTNPGPSNFENRGNKSRNLSSLINIKCTPSHTFQRQLISVCLLNIRSFKNKSAAFYDYICDCKANLIAVTET